MDEFEATEKYQALELPEEEEPRPKKQLTTLGNVVALTLVISTMALFVSCTLWLIIKLFETL